MRRLLYPGMIMITILLMAGCGSDKKNSAKETDAYLWLENVEGEKALDWARAQNKISDEAFKTQPLFAQLRDRFLEVFNDKERVIYPDMEGNYIYNLWQDEKNERGLWRRMSKEDYLSGKKDWETVLDLDQLSAKENRKWVFNGASWLGPENNLCLLSLSDGGKDESVIREFDVTNKSFVNNGFSVNESKGDAAWVDRDHILVATNYGPGTMTTSGYPSIVKIWTRGADPGEAETLLTTDTSHVSINVFGINVADKQYAFISESISGFTESKIYFYTSEGIKWIDIPLDIEFHGMHGNNLLLYLQSDWKIGNETYKSGSLVSFDLQDFLAGKKTVRTIYQPEERASFVSLMSAKDFIVVSTMENVQSKLKIFRSTGDQWIGEAVPVPEFGTISLVSSDTQSDDYFFSFSNPVTPSTLYYGDGKKITAIRKQKDYFDASGLAVEQSEAVSKDGTIIPYFIVHPKDMVSDGKNPTLIYGYGGFNISEQPRYSSVIGIGWLEHGGVYVIANIRGGGEFGPAWHQAALKEKRQNAYDDFFAVAEDIISKKITSPEYLGAYGWSNGGLLAGVALTQRPDLYGAVVVGAPLLDMKRYSHMLAGASWMDEFGNPDKPEDWAYISKYSPYQNLNKKTKYPEPLFITSTKDDRVHPGHARKMAAKMTDMGHPVYFHETIEGGHGAASTNAQEADMWALMYTYLNIKLNHR
jgi:prolyl oligopeptidase